MLWIFLTVYCLHCAKNYGILIKIKKKRGNEFFRYIPQKSLLVFAQSEFLIINVHIIHSY